MIGFERKLSGLNELEALGLVGIEAELDALQLDRISTIKNNWNFYDGYHWETIPENDKPEVTTNFCRIFCDKLVAFELGRAFTFKLGEEESIVTDDGRSLFEYLEDIWEDNNQYLFATEMGLMKSVTGDAWIKVSYLTPKEIDDPFSQYEKGRIKIDLMNTSTVFPEFEPHDKDVLRRLTIMYPIEIVEVTPITQKERKKKVMFKQIWTKDEIIEYEGSKETSRIPNKYKVIPFVQIKNLPLPGREYGRSDIDDVIPLNIEYNMKQSDVSEILDYHSAPITLVYGAKIGNLEKGANKVWGGLPVTAKVENLNMNTDLNASNIYLSTLKLSMCEVASVPETCLGGAQAISNTSGVALQYINLPLIEKTRIKKSNTENGLEIVNKLVLLVSLLEGLITKPTDISIRDFLQNEVTIPDTLPKDMLLELQQIQLEMTMGLEDRMSAMQRLGKENIDDKIKDIDEDRSKNKDLYGIPQLAPNTNAKVNSGFINGEKPTEPVPV